MRRASLTLALAVLTSASVCHAGAEENKADAQAAFELGRKLVLQGKFNEACPKFEESERLDPGLGTMLFLADCYEKIGKTASAWGQFREAEAIAAKEQDGRERIAHDRAAVLEPKLSKIIVKVGAAQKIDGLHVTRDGDDIGEGVWNIPLPVDPGPHDIGANATGRKSWSEHLTIATNASTVTVVVPTLLEDPNAVAGPIAGPNSGGGPNGGNGGGPAPETPQKDGNAQRLMGVGAVGVGVVASAVGIIFGLEAKSHLNDSNSNGHCHDGNFCDSQGVTARSDAKSAATISTVAFIASGVLIAGGAVLYLTAPHAKKTTATLSPSVGPKTAGLMLGASW